MSKTVILKIFLVTLILLGCNDVVSTKENQVDKKNISIVPKEERSDNYIIEQKVYVPIYSDIYSQTKDVRFQLTATLSIRNISPTDTLFINTVNYHNTVGDKVRSYVTQPIFLKPLETLDYVIEQEDTEGGTGANFIIDWAAKKELKPLFQAVMIGVVGQQGFAFTTEGIAISSSP
ncbi:DUF3124 domain-containing protein [Maribacter sp.]|nr:DUF3124 domain-containing protein [Maribacter sp.]